MEFYVKRKTLSHSDDELQHFGILGMKWGVRRYQNYDGTLTDAGKKRNMKIDNKISKIEEENKRKLEEYNNLIINGLYAGAPIDLIMKVQGFQVEDQAKIKQKIKKLEDKKIKELPKIRDESGRFTKEYKDEALKDAIEKDRYNIDFLEFIQNKTYLSSNDPKQKEKRLKEYEIFLNSDDPYSYRPPKGDEE